MCTQNKEDTLQLNGLDLKEVLIWNITIKDITILVIPTTNSIRSMKTTINMVTHHALKTILATIMIQNINLTILIRIVTPTPLPSEVRGRVPQQAMS